MTNKEQDLVARIGGVTCDIEDYIASNSNWIYYFLNPLDGDDEELFDCMREHPDDWDEYISFVISNISGPSVQIKIHIDDYTDCGIVLGRYIYLLNFEETIERNKMLYDGKLNEIRKKNIEEDIVRLKDALSKKEDELKRLEGNDSEL